jgi:glycerol-3-phosphate acyltransferase PlsX
MKKIAFDVMGNDNGVEAAIIASMQFVKKYNDYAIVLVGDENLINKTLIPHERIGVVNNPNDIDKTSSLRSAHLDNNSMTTTLKLLKEGEVDACLSSGDSGRLMISSIFLLKRLKGISRPAFMPIFPCIIKDKKFVMLDVGANLDINAEHLVQ